jgi:hypothetical protein
LSNNLKFLTEKTNILDMQHRRLLLPQHPGVQTYASTIDHTCPDGHFELLSGAVAASQRRGGATSRKHTDPEFPELTETGACCRPATVLFFNRRQFIDS